MGVTHFIPDGYEEPAYIAERPGVHKALRFAYRPMLVEARDTLAIAANKKPKESYHAILAAAMASRIVGWSASDPSGKPLPVTAASILGLRPLLFDRLYSIISGDSAGDIDPQETPEKVDEAAEAALQAAITGIPVQQAKQEANAKN